MRLWTASAAGGYGSTSRVCEGRWKPDQTFRWQRYLEILHRDFAQEGIPVDVQDRSHPGTAVQKAFVKTDSIGKILTLDLPFERHQPRKIRIKLEIDTNPPAGSMFTTSYITFPVTAALTTQSLESGFSLKLHALLCRSYVKGRDWSDFVWYVSRRIRPDLDLLRNALQQEGSWAGQQVTVTPEWLQARLTDTIRSIDWTAARNDVRRFLPLQEQEALSLWSEKFFLHHLATMGDSVT